MKAQTLGFAQHPSDATTSLKFAQANITARQRVLKKQESQTFDWEVEASGLFEYEERPVRQSLVISK